MPVGDMVVFFDRELAHEFEYRCKQAGQLAAKMRFLAAPWLGMLDEDAWLRHAGHANRQAAELSRRLQAIPGVTLLFPTEANSVFVALPKAVRQGLRERGWSFYTFIHRGRRRSSDVLVGHDGRRRQDPRSRSRGALCMTARAMWCCSNCECRFTRVSFGGIVVR